jgi:benzoylformate decarboxylase
VSETVTVREATFKLLRAFGIRRVFGNPGSTELPMFRDFPDDFEYVLGLQESVVIGMADGYAQATRNAALVNLHSAAGVGHGLGNLFTAFKNQTPLVVTAGQQARSILPYEPFLFAREAAQFPKPYVKWSIEPARAADVPAAIARAYYVAMQPPRGPTFVSVPVDDWDEAAEPLEPREVARVIRGDPALIAEAAKALAAAKRPVIVAGAAVARDDGWDEIIALAERLAAPVWAAPMSGRNSFPEDHPLFAGFLNPNREEIVANLEGADVILVLGAPVFIYHVEGFGPHAPPGAKLFHVTDNPDAAAFAPVGVSIVSSLRAGIADLLAVLPAAARALSKVRPTLEPLSGDVLTDDYLMQQIAQLRPAGAVVVEEAPSSRGAMRDRLPMIGRDSFYTCESGGLGHGLPAAVGVALARPDDKVIALIGDGSSLYAIQGLWSAAQLGLPITFVIVNNRRYEALVSFGHHFGLQRTYGTALDAIDFCAIAEGFGVKATRVTESGALDAALAQAFAARGPTLVEVMVT